MSKYIIELDYDLQRVVGVGVKQGTVWVKDYDVDDLEELCDDYIRKEYRELPTEAYKRGYDYGLLKGKHDAEQDMYDKGYQKGFEEGKEAINKGCEGCKYLDTPSTSPACCICSNNFDNHWTAKEKDDEINVGDEVDWSGDKFIVTRIFQPYDKAEECDGVDMDGCTYHDVLISGLTKTGRHVDITDMLKGALE